MSADAAPPLSLLRLPAVVERTGLSKTEIYRRIRAGVFPPQLKRGSRTSVWPSDAVDAWIARDLAALKGDHPSPGPPASLLADIDELL